jgi:hypothetical protein
VLYGGACEALRGFAERHGVPVCETQAGKSSLPWDHPLQLGSVGVTGSAAANAYINPPQGFVFQRVYSDSRDLDESMAVEDRNVVLVPRGYHPARIRILLLQRHGGS